MKKRLAAVLCLSMMMGVLAGCSGGNSAGAPAKETAQAEAGTGNAEQAESKPEKAAADSAGGEYADFPTKNITYICSGSAGGGLDLCARMISPYIEK